MSFAICLGGLESRSWEASHRKTSRIPQESPPGPLLEGYKPFVKFARFFRGCFGDSADALVLTSINNYGESEYFKASLKNPCRPPYQSTTGMLKHLGFVLEDKETLPSVGAVADVELIIIVCCCFCLAASNGVVTYSVRMQLDRIRDRCRNE